MDKYYYLLSQLPLLQFNKRPEITESAFLAEAVKWLSPGDYSSIREADIDDFLPRRNRVRLLDDYRSFEISLRTEIKSYRQGRGNGTEKTSKILNPSLMEGNPLEVEKRLLFLRWRYIESQQSGHYFDIGGVICYFLKLQVLERMSTFDKKKGAEIFNSLCEVEK